MKRKLTPGVGIFNFADSDSRLEPRRPQRRVLSTNLRSDHSSKGGNETFYKHEIREMGARWVAEWKEALSFKFAGQDLLAGLTVAAVALPLNLALAVVCGLPPSAGLLAGAIGGGVAAIFGGARLQVTGPAAAFNLMVLMIVKDFGVAGAAAAAVMIAGIQIILSFLLAGRLVHYVSEAVLAGFMTGVGLKLLDSQIPEILGFNYRVFEMAQMLHRPEWLHEVSWIAVVCGLFVAFLVVSTRHIKRFPAALLGVAIVTALSVYLSWDIERVGVVNAVLPDLALPQLDADKWLPLFIRTIPLGILAAVESLLSAQAIDRMLPKEKPHNSNLELFGQGLGNLASGLMAGMPVSGVIVRSSVNVQSGGKTKLASLTHGLILLFSVLYLSDQIAKIPLAGLAGLLCVVGMRLVEVKTLYHLLKTHKLEAAAFLFAAVGTVSGHLVAGLVLGLAISGFDALLKRKSKERDKKVAAYKGSGLRASVSSEKTAARKPSHYEPATGGLNWLEQIRERAQIAATAFVHGQATVIGRVVLGENVHIAAGSTIRADEGTPFFIGTNTNIQDGVVIHALKEKWIQVGGEEWAVYIGQNVSVAHQAMVHGPCFIGDNSFVGFKAVVHDSVVGTHCFIGIGAVVVGVEIPDGRYVPHGMVVDTMDKVDALPKVSDSHMHFNEDVVDVNRGLVAAYREISQDGAAGHPALAGVAQDFSFKNFKRENLWF